MCLHRNIENKSLLEDGRKGKSVERVPPPVPDRSSAEFHYCSLQQVLNGDVTEGEGVVKPNVKNATERERDDFCPRKQLEKIIEQCGEPDFEKEQQVQCDGSISMLGVDKNNTLQKYYEHLDSFVRVFAGEDLHGSVEHELKRRHEMKVKTAISREMAANTRAAEKAKTYDDIEWSKHIYSNTLDKLYVSQLHLYLIEKMGYTKKILPGISTSLPACKKIHQCQPRIHHPNLPRQLQFLFLKPQF